MSAASQITLNAGLYSQVWSSSDLNPDRLTSELSKFFTYNDTETKLHNYTDTYFNLDREYLQQSSSSSSGAGNGNIEFFDLFSLGGGGSSSSSSSNSLRDNLKRTTNDKYSLTDIRRLLTEQQSEFQWQGEKFIAKSFNVYKLIDLNDYLQVAMISKQLIAEKTNGAIVRQISTLDAQIVYANKPSTFLTGTIQIFAGATTPTSPWLLCNGTAVSRIQYQRLFSVIGTSYGTGDGSTTFNLPDFRGRFPLGVDESRAINSNAEKVGLLGGVNTHQLSIEQLPSHTHEQGTLYAMVAGDHSHSYIDPGHDRGGQTGSGIYGRGHFDLSGVRGGANEYGTHTHPFARDVTNITINSGGNHNHQIAGATDSVGSGHPFSLLSPYQTVNYIIYSD